jgi:hypothetical protein
MTSFGKLLVAKFERHWETTVGAFSSTVDPFEVEQCLWATRPPPRPILIRIHEGNAPPTASQQVIQNQEPQASTDEAVVEKGDV